MNKLYEPKKIVANAKDCLILEKNISENPDWFNAPVPNFGESNSTLLIKVLHQASKEQIKLVDLSQGTMQVIYCIKHSKKFGFSNDLYHGMLNDGLRVLQLFHN